jgi:hypothetical protein
LVYNGAGKVPPAPFRGTRVAVVAVVVVVVIVEVTAGAVVVAVVVIVEVVAGWVTVEVTVVAVPKAMGVVLGVVVLLQALNTEVATSSNTVKAISHFLLNLFDNLRSPFSYFFHYKRPSLRRV